MQYIIPTGGRGMFSRITYTYYAAWELHVNMVFDVFWSESR